MLWLLVYWLLRRLVGLLARGADGERDREVVVLRYQSKALSRQERRRLHFRPSGRAVGSVTRSRTGSATAAVGATRAIVAIRPYGADICTPSRHTVRRAPVGASRVVG